MTPPPDGPPGWPTGTQPLPRATRYEPWRLMSAPPDSGTNSSPVTAPLSPLPSPLSPLCRSSLLHVASFTLFTIYHPGQLVSGIMSTQPPGEPSMHELCL